MSQAYGFSCKGGLNTNLNSIEILGNPGFAKVLENFEVDPDGGYRRINGFTAYGGASATRPNGSNAVLGIQPYADGVVVCSGTDMFFSNDGVTWLQINRSGVAGGGDNYTTFTGRSVLTRTDQGQCQFALLEGASFNYGQLVIADGANKLYKFRMEGTGLLNTRTFFAGEITVDGSNAVKYITVHDHHLIASGVADNLNTIYYSVYNDATNFTGAGAGAVAISDQVQGIKGFRENLIVFSQNSIHKLININDSSNVRVDPITENVGCLSGYSIQEFGGDLVFLAPDGIRTIAGTARIGDVELSSISRQIQEIVTALTTSTSSFIITSDVLRSKSQYRLFYSTIAQNPSEAKGIIGTFTGQGFEWSETKGIQALGFASGFNSNGVEVSFHGDKDGYVYNHDTGDSFLNNGSEANIFATYQTPDIDCGDIGTRKTLKYVRTSFSPEGDLQPVLRLRYDYQDSDIPQPSDYTLTDIPLPAIFGTSIFGVATFGASADPMFRQTVEGSGSTVSFRIRSDDKRSPYAINGFYIDYMPSGRR
jgi:hypothetical protein